MLRRAHANLAAVVLLAATPVATWWLSGDQSEVDVNHPERAYYMYRPVDVSASTERACGLAATLLAGFSVVVLAQVTRRGTVDSRWWRCIVPLLLAGAYAGWGWRVVTAAVSGANIGGGMVMMLGMVLVPSMVIWSALTWATAHRTR